MSCLVSTINFVSNVSSPKKLQYSANLIADCNIDDYMNDKIYYNDSPGYNYSTGFTNISLNNGDNERVVSPVGN